MFVVEHHSAAPHKHFLYCYLKDQPLWQSVKFWNAACFDAIMTERTKRVPRHPSECVTSL